MLRHRWLDRSAEERVHLHVLARPLRGSGFASEDMRLFHRAHISELTLNVFSWGLLQPSEEQYDFSQLDSIMDLCRREGISVILATSTAAQPAWMSARYPETNRTDAHENRHHFGEDCHSG